MAAPLSTGWLGSDESVLWSGVPARRRVGVSGLAVATALVLWLVLVAFLFSVSSSPRWFLVVVSVVFVAGLSQTVVSFLVRGRRDRHSTYVLTTRRAVIVRRAAVAAEAPLPTAALVRRDRTGPRGTVLFLSSDAAEADPSSTIYDVEVPWSVVRRGVGEPTLLSFTKIDRLDALVTALRYAGVDPIESAAPRSSTLLGVALGMPVVGGAGGAASGRRRRAPVAWFRERLLRRTVRLDSPLAPAVAIARLGACVTAPPKGFFAATTWTGYAGYVQGWQLTAWSRSPGDRNASWRFEGSLYSGQGGGAALVGRVGPVGFVPLFIIAWSSVVGLVFVGGCIGCAVSLAKGTTPPWPALFVPTFMLGIALLVTETMYRQAAAGWARLAQHLRTALEAPGPFVEVPKG